MVMYIATAFLCNTEIRDVSCMFNFNFNSNFISHLWPNGQITGNVTFYKTHRFDVTHKITSKQLNLNTLKLHS